MNRKKIASVAAGVAAAAMALTGCAGGGQAGAAGGDEDELVIWHFESENSAMGQAWAHAIEIFEAENPDVTVRVEPQTFEGIQRNAQIVLTSNDVPDVLLYNKGNATAGQLAAQGLIRPITDIALERGWDQIVTGNLLTTSLYDENGQMGSGEWFGVPNNGELVGMYYNRAMFDAAGVDIPTTLAELEDVMQTFVDQGITPLATSGSEHPITQVWYQLVLYYANQQLINDFQLFENDVDFMDDAMVQGTERLAEWIDRGFVDPAAVAIQAEDMGLGFISGNFPMMFSGSWWFGRLNTEMTDDFGMFLFPESDFSLGSAGNLWTIPTNAANPGNAAEFIDITLRPEVQNTFAEAGGLAINADDNVNITDPRTKELLDNFETALDMDALAFYPDWPVPGFMNVLTSNLQALWNGSVTPTQMLETISAEYFAARDAQ